MLERNSLVLRIGWCDPSAKSSQRANVVSQFLLSYRRELRRPGTTFMDSNLLLFLVFHWRHPAYTIFVDTVKSFCLTDVCLACMHPMCCCADVDKQGFLARVSLWDAEAASLASRSAGSPAPSNIRAQ